MAKRLNYSPAAFIKTYRLSRANLHVFVEGRDVDPGFYSRIVESVVGNRIYRLVRSDEIVGYGSGKVALLAHFREMRRSRLLTGRSSTSAYALTYFLDKDVDDIESRRVRSPHVIYTRQIDVEAEIFFCGDIGAAVSAALYVDITRARLTVVDFLPAAVRLWQEWVVLCLAGRRMGAHSVPNFSAFSQVNPTKCKPEEPGSCDAFVKRLATASGLSVIEARGVQSNARRVVDRRFRNGQALTLFKGKWLAELLSHECERVFPLEYRRTSFKRVVMSCLLQSVDALDTRLDHLRRPVLQLLAMC